MHCFRLTQQSASLLIILFTIPDSVGVGITVHYVEKHPYTIRGFFLQSSLYYMGLFYVSSLLYIYIYKGPSYVEWAEQYIRWTHIYRRLDT